MKRRTFIHLALGTLGAGVLDTLLVKPLGVRATATAAAIKIKWRNWSGNLQASPSVRYAPNDERDLRRWLKTAPTPIRPVGSGHSFSPLVPSAGSILSLDLLADVKKTNRTAQIGAGARLRNIARTLDSFGVAFRNLPDIDKQSLAGAVSTATHGTGKNFSSLSAEIQSVRLMTADGTSLTCSPTQNAEVFSAAAVSLGAVGVLTSIEMNIVPAYRLHRRTWFEPFTDLVARAPALWEQHSKFEFYFLPFTDFCLAISHDETERPITPRPPVGEDDGLRSLQSLRDWLSWQPTLRRTLAASLIAQAPVEDVVGESYDLLSAAREVRFNEMEYHLPASVGLQVLAEVKETIETKHPDVFFPLEVRYIQSDDKPLWLSPFQQGDRISIAVHAHYQDSYQPLFADIEPIFKKYKGRPHWGKINTLGKKELAALYPDWEKFVALRRRLDPKGKFLNSYLAKLFI